MIELEYEMSYAETIEGPLPPTCGSPAAFENQYMRIVPQFDVGTGDYDWLRENVFVARGRLTGPRAIEYEIYRVG